MTDAIRVDKRARLARNSLLGLLAWVFPAIPSLIVTPIVVHRLGSADYGLYIAIIGITGFFFTSGVGRIAAKYVAEYRATDDDQRASEMLSATLVVTLVPTVIGLIFLAVTAPFVVNRVLLIATSQELTATEGLWIAGAVIIVTALTQVWQSALQGLHRFDALFWVSNVSSLTSSIGIIAIVLAGGGVLSLLGWAAVSGFLTLVISFVAVRRVWPACRLTLRIPRSEWRQVCVYAGSVMGYQFFGIVVLLFERSWILRNFGPESAAYYLIPMNLALLLLGFISSLLGALSPALNEHLRDARTTADLYRRSSKLVLVIVVFAIVGAVAGGQTFFRLWLGDVFAERSASLLVIHTITFSLISMSLIGWQLAEAHRSSPINASTNLGLMVVTIPMMVVLGGSTGLAGIAVARLVGLVPYIALWAYVESRFAGGFSVRYWLGLLKAIILPAMLSYAAFWVCLSYLGQSWPTFIAAVAISGVLYLGSLFLLGAFDASEILMLKGVFARRAADARV